MSALRFLFIKTLHRHSLSTFRLQIPQATAHLYLARRRWSTPSTVYGTSIIRTLLMTVYSTAMRRAELCRLKVHDIDRNA